jgi:hypothetical protein
MRRYENENSSNKKRMQLYNAINDLRSYTFTKISLSRIYKLDEVNPEETTHIH